MEVIKHFPSYLKATGGTHPVLTGLDVNYIRHVNGVKLAGTVFTFVCLCVCTQSSQQCVSLSQRITHLADICTV